MKIVHITTVHDPYDNRIFHKECLSIARMGHLVTLLAPHQEDQHVEDVFIKALPGAGNRLERMLKTNYAAYKKALDEDADIYHFHDPEFIPLAWLMAVKYKKKMIYDVHEDYYSSIKSKPYLPPVIRSLIAVIFSLFEKVLSRRFAKVLAEKYYRGRFPEGVTVLNYPGSNLLLNVPVNRAGSEKKFLYTGNITKDRGALAHANIVNYVDSCLVYLVGRCEPGFADRLLALAGENRDRLVIVGRGRYVPFEEIIKYYALGGWTAGLALFPPNDHYDNKELTKFFEYMGAGIPVVCSDFPAWRSLFEETGAGLCVDPLDEKRIKETLEYLFDNRDVAEQMGSKGRASVQNQFKWENEALKLDKLYRELVKETEGI